ncbi:MAG: Cna B-type domain-containing protein [Clostridia bacterium]
MTEPDTVEIAGNKTWNHGDNPEDKWPDSIVVEVYADGQLAAQRLVTAGDGWQYAFELPKYAEDGHEVVYTVGEVNVPDYTTEIKGYDVLNTYHSNKPADPDKPDESGEPDNPGNPHDPPDRRQQPSHDLGCATVPQPHRAHHDPVAWEEKIT